MVTARDVVLLRFPYSATKTPAYKKRPVVVLSVGAMGEGATAADDEAILCMMITGNPDRWSSPGTFDRRIDRWASIPLAKESVLRVNRLWTATSDDVIRILGQLDEPTFRAAYEDARQLLLPLPPPPSNDPMASIKSKSSP